VVQTEIRDRHSGKIIREIPEPSARQIRKDIAGWESSSSDPAAAWDVQALADLMEARSADLSRTYSSESGKPILQASAEISRSIAFLRSLGTFHDGGISPHGIGQLHQSFLIPENANMQIAFSSIDSPVEDLAIALGASIVESRRGIVAGSGTSPLTFSTIGELIGTCEMDGKFKLLPFAALNPACIKNVPTENVDRVIHFGRKAESRGTFTQIAQVCDRLVFERTASASLVWKDADPDHAVDAVFSGSFMNDSSFDDIKYLLVHPEQTRYIQNQLTEKIHKLKTKDPSIPGSDLFAFSDKAQAEVAMSELDRYVSSGNEYVYRGETVSDRHLLPSLLRSHSIPLPGIFEKSGKYLIIAEVSSVNESVELLNGLGNLSSISAFFSDIHYAKLLSERLKAGYIFFNTFPAEAIDSALSAGADLTRMSDIMRRIIGTRTPFRRVFYEN
jgi:acyl-CoA reductase-like NAD-dependent aldehyde dehydrogenase